MLVFVDELLCLGVVCLLLVSWYVGVSVRCRVVVLMCWSVGGGCCVVVLMIVGVCLLDYACWCDSVCIDVHWCIVVLVCWFVDVLVFWHFGVHC